jgi:hypothetical protein
MMVVEVQLVGSRSMHFEAEIKVETFFQGRLAVIPPEFF